MNNINPDKPLILVIAGHDPCGGAGIQADIESIASQGGRAVTVITSLTAQNTTGVGNVVHQKPDNFREQLDMVLDEMKISACKIGLVADSSIIEIIRQTLSVKIPGIPIVEDPVITAGSGHVFIDQSVQDALCSKLIPYATVCTPNTIEARTLANTNNLDKAAACLIESGARSVLITGEHEEQEYVINTLYTKDKEPIRYKWDRLPGKYHGSGCTLSASIAAHLANGEDIEMAVHRAQVYTWNSLKYAGHPGRLQYHPDRFFWNPG
ncbi:MAG TPA: hydroxymethylpyrimidine/phosphomethylpyrimidine kinase [Gammaproteobacteria bacterium]|nr:hydroxymethylpyrimidine/phosphomethylpyrimidine kinase [Gammaproteobacteria bacterium]